MKVIGYHGWQKDGVGFLANSLGEIRAEPPYLDWLLDQPADARACYDIDAFAAVLFRLVEITKAEVETWHDSRKIYIPPYEITYIPAKYLGISKGKGWGRPYVGFHNAEQYFELSSLDGSPTHAQVIDKAKLAEAKAREVLDIFQKLGLSLKLTSPIAALENSLLVNMDFPNHKNVPPEANEMADRACPGNWVEAFAIGHYPTVYDLDISGAYASKLAELYDIRRGDWLNAPERPTGAVYGFARVKVNIEAEFSPILYYIDSETTYSPQGEWETYLTAQELDFIEQYKLGSYKILDAWWWVPVGKRGNNGQLLTTYQHQPMKGIINNLWQKRQGTEGLEKKIVKRCMAGLWGKTLHQMDDKVASKKGKVDMYNPVWGAIVEATTRLEVARLALDNGIIPLAVAVDGIITTKPLPVPDTGELGTWRLSHTGAVIIAGSGLVAMQTKDGEGDFALRYDWLKSAIEADPLVGEYVMDKVSVVTLASALQSDFASLGNTKRSTRTVKIGADTKRFYMDEPETGAELLNNQYESMPLLVDDIMVAQH